MRLTRGQLRELLVEAGLDILQEEGLSTGADRLTFKRVFERLTAEHGITTTNASVIGRIWRNNAEYQSEVLARAVRDETPGEVDFALEEARHGVEMADLSTVSGRRAALSELCRRAGGASSDALAHSRSWPLFIGIWANLASAPEASWDHRIIDAATQTYSILTRRFEDRLNGFADILGLRLRDGLTFSQFAVAVMSMAEGCAMRDRIDPSSTRGIKRDQGEGVEEWSLFALGLEAMIWQFFEMLPDGAPAGAATPAPNPA